MPTRISRRQLLKRVPAAGAGLGALIGLKVPLWAAEPSRPAPPSESIVLGFIGVGGMGSGHLGAFLGRNDVRIAAVCDVDENHRNAARARVGGDCAAYNDLRELLDRKDIDAVVIATPDHWHALATIYACQAGKDVYCEKPFSLTIEDGRAMVNAVRRYGRVFQTGSQQRSEAGFRIACEAVRHGRIGKLHTVRTGIGGNPTCGWEPDSDPPPGLDWNLWLGPAPWRPYNKRRCHFDFRWYWDTGGGMMCDWGHHHNDIAQWGIGADGSGPVEITGWGIFPTEGLFECPTQFEATYRYPNGITLICATRSHGVRFEGSDGWVHVDRGFLEASDPEIIEDYLRPGEQPLPRSVGHHQDWLDCIKSRKRPICDAEIGHRSVTVCHLGNIAIRTGRKLVWDPVAERITNDEALNRWLGKPYRPPWHL